MSWSWRWKKEATVSELEQIESKLVTTQNCQNEEAVFYIFKDL